MQCQPDFRLRTAYELRQGALAKLSGKWPGAAAVVFLAALAGNAVGGLNFAAKYAAGEPDVMPLPTFSFALFVVSWLVAAQFKAGVSLYFLRLVRGDAPGVAAIFASFRDFAAFRRNVWLLLLISAYTFFWSLLLIIPGIVKGLGYSMAWYVKADAPHLSANQAIDASAEMMRGHKMRLFWLDLSFFGWMLSPVVILFILLPYAPFLAFLAAGIATVFANVYLEAAMALFYQNLKEYSAASLPSAEAEAAPGALLR